ncbi:MAG: GrpB family protein [bacterium]
MEASGKRPAIGLKRGTVELLPYGAEWRRLFEEEKTRLQNAIGQYVLDIQHIGSTAVPGMIAKPIIDIGIAVMDFEEARVCIARIEHLGYEYRGEQRIPRRHYFVKGEPRTHHIHMNEIGSRAWKNDLLFRDYLIHHPEVAGEYAGLKQELARRFPTHREAYLDRKASFIDRVLRTARGELGPMS